MWKRLWRNAVWESIELFIAIACLLSGITILTNPVFAPALLAAESPTTLVAWAISLLLGGSLNGVGILFGNLYLRRAGLVLLGGAAFCLMIVLLVPFVPSALVGALTYGLAAAALFARYRVLGQVHQHLHTVAELEQSDDEE